MSQQRQTISFQLRREYKDLRNPGKLSGLIDFNLHGKNRYMKINQPVKSQNEPRMVSPRSSPVRDKKSRFKNPILNRYEDSGDEEYEAKKYVFDYEDGDSVDKIKKKTRRRVRNKQSDEVKIDERKVDKTVKMIEDLLKEEKRPKKLTDNETEPNEQDKQAYLREKNIQVNLSTMDSEDVNKIAQKPKKNKATDVDSEKKWQTISTQTPREIYEQMQNDHLRFSENGSVYVKKLLDDVEIINQEENKDNTDFGKIKKEKGTNSLGLNMEGNNGVNMAIIKSKNKNSDPSSKLKANEEVLLRKNYQNLEELISIMIEKGNDENYLKLAKLYRLKVLIELATKMIGRKYKDISDDERNALDMHANRFHTTYPMPGEEQPLEELDEDGRVQTRLPLKIVQHDTMAKIDLNDKFLIDPADFLKIYTNKIIDHAHETSGLDFDNITVTIPAAYGAHQREAIKSSLNEGSDRDDVKILTRPVAAAVIQNNQNPAPSTETLFKVVFDMTDMSMDASIIRIHEGKDFQVVSNVGDSSFGIHDIDQRIVGYIIKERADRHIRMNKEEKLVTNLETVNAYNHLIKSIKETVVENDAVSVDLTTLEDKTTEPKSNSEVLINKKLISKSLCKDIYDWSLVHIEKAINQADTDDKHLDEIILIGSEAKFPGFKELLQQTYPKKKISFVSEQDLSVGAAIVGKKLKYQQIKVTEVLCRSIGIGLYTGCITYLLFRNSSLPCVGGCVYSTLVDDQESMVLDVYEGERPHVKFCRYLGEVKIYNLPKGEAGKIKCEVNLKMNNEGILEVTATELSTGKTLETDIDANPENMDPNDVDNSRELDPVEAERYKKPDYDFVYELETLDEYLELISVKFRKHKMNDIILDKVFDTKEWLYKNRKKITMDDIQQMRKAINNFLKNLD